MQRLSAEGLWELSLQGSNLGIPRNDAPQASRLVARDTGVLGAKIPAPEQHIREEGQSRARGNAQGNKPGLEAECCCSNSGQTNS